MSRQDRLEGRRRARAQVASEAKAKDHRSRHTPAQGILVGRSELVTATIIASRLGVTRERVRQFRTRDMGMPEPVGELAPDLHVWRWAPVRRWAVKTGRLEE